MSVTSVEAGVSPLSSIERRELEMEAKHGSLPDWVSKYVLRLLEQVSTEAAYEIELEQALDAQEFAERAQEDAEDALLDAQVEIKDLEDKVSALTDELDSLSLINAQLREVMSNEE